MRRKIYNYPELKSKILKNNTLKNILFKNMLSTSSLVIVMNDDAYDN